jgi:hypothetical protein
MPAKNTTPATALQALLAAAERLTAARADEQVTATEWDALAAAISTARQVMPSIPTEPDEMLATLKITKTTRRHAGAGKWISGTIAGHAFEALVFPEHAETASYELGDSRITKLHLREIATEIRVACFDRGWDMQPTTDAARAVAHLLAAGLAETVYGK